MEIKMDGKQVLIIIIFCTSLTASDNALTALYTHRLFQRTQSAPALISLEKIAVSYRTEHEQVPLQTTSPVHEVTMPTITNSEPDSPSCTALTTALLIHNQLNTLEEKHTSSQNTLPFLCVAFGSFGVGTAYYLYKTRNHVRQKFNIDIPLTPLIVTACIAGTVAYLRHWWNEDSFKALDKLHEAQTQYSRTLSELNDIKNRLKLVERTNTTLWQRLEPCEKSMQEILTKISQVMLLDGDHTHLAKIGELTITLCKLNAQRHNELVHHLVPTLEQKKYLINFSDKSLEEAEAITTLTSTAAESGPALNECAAQEQYHIASNRLAQENEAVAAYHQKHPLKSVFSGAKTYKDLPEEWRKKHYLNLEQDHRS